VRTRVYATHIISIFVLCFQPPLASALVGLDGWTESVVATQLSTRQAIALEHANWLIVTPL
jgi:hypothetical protein